MWRILLKRLLLSVPALFVVTILTFVLAGLIPGDVATVILGANATPEKLAALREQLNVTEPLLVQYWTWLTNALGGDLGTSIFTTQTVTAILQNSVPITLTLIIGSVLISAILGIPLGVISARRRRSGGKVIDVMSMIAYAIPSFFLGVLLALLFSNVLNVLPASGYVPFSDSPEFWLRSITLPLATLSLPGIAIVARQTRQSMLEIVEKDYIRSLRARGLSDGSVIYKHALRNGLGNVVSMLGLYAVGLLLGTTLVETIFAMQGLGSVAVTATRQRNLPVLAGAALCFTLIVVVTFALVDIVRAILNPKLRTR